MQHAVHTANNGMGVIKLLTVGLLLPINIIQDLYSNYLCRILLQEEKVQLHYNSIQEGKRQTLLLRANRPQGRGRTKYKICSDFCAISRSLTNTYKYQHSKKKKKHCLWQVAAIPPSTSLFLLFSFSVLSLLCIFSSEFLSFTQWFILNQRYHILLFMPTWGSCAHPLKTVHKYNFRIIVSIRNPKTLYARTICNWVKSISVTVLMKEMYSMLEFLYFWSVHNPYLSFFLLTNIWYYVLALYFVKLYTLYLYLFSITLIKA